MHSNQCMQVAADDKSLKRDCVFCVSSVGFQNSANWTSLILLRNEHHAVHTGMGCDGLWRKQRLQPIDDTHHTSGHTHISSIKYMFCDGEWSSGMMTHPLQQTKKWERWVWRGIMFTWSPPSLRVNSTSSTRWFEKEQMLAPTDLDRAGVLRVVQQPHSAVAFPVQTPDAAAH